MGVCENKEMVVEEEMDKGVQVVHLGVQSDSEEEEGVEGMI